MAGIGEGEARLTSGSMLIGIEIELQAARNRITINASSHIG